MSRFVLVFIFIASTPFVFSADDNSKKEEGVQGEKGEVYVSPVTTEEDREQIRRASPDHITWDHVAELIMLIDPKAHKFLRFSGVRKLLEDQDVRESIVADRGNTSEITWKYLREDGVKVIQRMDPQDLTEQRKNDRDLGDTLSLDERYKRFARGAKNLGHHLWIHQIKGFPLEAFVFYSAIGASMYRQYYTDSLQGGIRDPRWMENFMHELTSPVGVFSFFCFVLASGITNNLYTQLYASKKVPAAISVLNSSRERRIWGGSRYYSLDNRAGRLLVPSQHFVNHYKYRFIGAFGGQFGMAMGMMASNVVHELYNLYAHDPNWKLCRDELIAKKSTEDSNHFCNLSYSQTAETALSWLPGLGSLISASLLSHWLVALSFRLGAGAGQGGAHLLGRIMPKIIPRMVITIPWFYLLKARLLIPGVGQVMAAGTWAGTFIFKVFAPRFINLYAFMEMDQLITHPLWEWIAGESLKANRVAGGITDFVENYTSNINYSTPWKSCTGEGEEEDCEYHPSVNSIHKTANRFNNWRQHKSAAMYMAYQTWSVYVSTALGSFEEAKKKYRAFFRSKIFGASPLNKANYFYGVTEKEASQALQEMLQIIEGHISNTGISEPESLNLNIVSASRSRFLKPRGKIQVEEEDRLFVLQEIFKVADIKSYYGTNWNNVLRTTKDSLKADDPFKKLVDSCFKDFNDTIELIRAEEVKVENDRDRFELVRQGLGGLLFGIDKCIESGAKEKDLLKTRLIVENFSGFLDPDNQKVEYTESDGGFLPWYFSQWHISIRDMSMVKDMIAFLEGSGDGDTEGSLSAYTFHQWLEKLLPLLRENQRRIQEAMNLTDDQWEQVAYKVLQEKLEKGAEANVNIEQIKRFYGEDWDNAVKTTKDFLKTNSPLEEKELIDVCFENFYHTIEIMRKAQAEDHENFEDHEKFLGQVDNTFDYLLNSNIEACIVESSKENFLENPFVGENFDVFIDLNKDLPNQRTEYNKAEAGDFLPWYFSQLYGSIINMALSLFSESDSLNNEKLNQWIDAKLLPLLRENQRRIQGAVNLTDYQLEQTAYGLLRKKVLAAGLEYLNNVVKWDMWSAQRESYIREPFVEDEDTDPELQRAYYLLGADNIYAQLYQHSYQIKPKTQGMAVVEDANNIYEKREEYNDTDYNPSRLYGLRTPGITDFIIASALCGPDSQDEEYQKINENIRRVLSTETVGAQAPEMTSVPAYTLETQFPDQNMNDILDQLPVFDSSFVGTSYSFYPPRIVRGVDEDLRRSICNGVYSMQGERGNDPENLYRDSTMSPVVEDIYNGYFPAKVDTESYFFGLIKLVKPDEDKVYSNLLHFVLDHIEAPSSMEEFDKWWEDNVQPQIDLFIKVADREYNMVMNDRFMIPFFASEARTIEITSASPSSSKDCEDPSTVSRWDLTFQEMSFFKPWVTVEDPQGYYVYDFGGSVDYTMSNGDCVKQTNYSTDMPRGLFQSIYLELHYWADMVLHFGEIRKKEHPAEEVRDRVALEEARNNLKSLIDKFKNLDQCLNAGPKERDKSLWDDQWDKFLWGESITKEKVRVCQNWVEEFMKSENVTAIKADIANIMENLSLSQIQLQALKTPGLNGQADMDEEEQEKDRLRKTSTAFKYNIDSSEYEVQINSIVDDPELTPAEKTTAIVQLMGDEADSSEVEQIIGSIIENPRIADAEKKSTLVEIMERTLGSGEEAGDEKIAALPDQLLNYSLSRVEYLATEEVTMYMNIIISLIDKQKRLIDNPQIEQNIIHPSDMR